MADPARPKPFGRRVDKGTESELNERDRASLMACGQLTDTVVNNHMIGLNRIHDGNGVWIMSSFLITRFRSFGHQGVANWAKKQGLNFCDGSIAQVIFPINITEPHHWVLLMVDLKSRIIFVFDSLDMRDKLRASIADVKNYLNEEQKAQGCERKDPFTYFHCNAPQQHNGYDCGLYMMLCATHLMEKKLVTADSYNEDDANALRKELRDASNPQAGKKKRRHK
jgi:Ulp1 family protease